MIDGLPVASTPSVITVVDARSLDPVATDRTRVGNELAVLVLPSAPWWWASPERTARVAPRAYGIDADVVQGGVQLMNFKSSWWSLRNVLEYYFWFHSRLHFHAGSMFTNYEGVLKIDGEVGNK
ncbi:DUF917 family protein, partial [Bacillus sp. S34]|nr:DUF917 family protein [Bacillus sp. S34]